MRREHCIVAVERDAYLVPRPFEIQGQCFDTINLVVGNQHRVTFEARRPVLIGDGEVSDRRWESGLPQRPPGSGSWGSYAILGISNQSVSRAFSWSTAGHVLRPTVYAMRLFIQPRLRRRMHPHTSECP